MAGHRNFRIVLVDGEHGAGIAVTKTANADVAYDGKEIQLKIR
jgi:hypothetical protein